MALTCTAKIDMIADFKLGFQNHRIATDLLLLIGELFWVATSAIISFFLFPLVYESVFHKKATFVDRSASQLNLSNERKFGN